MPLKSHDIFHVERVPPLSKQLATVGRKKLPFFFVLKLYSHFHVHNEVTVGHCTCTSCHQSFKKNRMKITHNPQ